MPRMVLLTSGLTPGPSHLDPPSHLDSHLDIVLPAGCYIDKDCNSMSIYGVYLPYLPIYLSINLSINMSTYKYIHLSVNLPPSQWIPYRR